MMRLRRNSLILTLCLAALSAAGQSVCMSGNCGGRVLPSRTVTHEWLYGAGHLNVLDTYLTPLEYTGPSLSVTHRSERLARWGCGKVTVQAFFTGQAAALSSPADNHDAFDGQITAAVAWHRNWFPVRGLRLAAGGMVQLGGGFTYLTTGGNNPAQGRLAVDAALSLRADYDFRPGRSGGGITSQLDLPFAGAMFTPNYGQSYYEIFSLGHYDRNVRMTHPFNAPSARWLTTLRLPLAGAMLSLGYLADIRQSDVNGLKRHAWNHHFVIGYVRRLQLFRP